MSPISPKYKLCDKCGTWVCHTCWDFRRTYANRATHQICANCGYDEGEFKPTYHRPNHSHLEGTDNEG